MPKNITTRTSDPNPTSVDLVYTAKSPFGTDDDRKVALSALGKGLDAGVIPNTAAGDIAATNVQDAINELDTDKLSTASAATVYLNKVDAASTYQPVGSYLEDGGDLGTPSAGVLTNCTFPTLNQNTTGTAANLSGTPALPDGTTATTQTAADNSTKLATTAYVDAAAGGTSSVRYQYINSSTSFPSATRYSSRENYWISGDSTAALYCDNRTVYNDTNAQSITTSTISGITTVSGNVGKLINDSWIMLKTKGTPTTAVIYLAVGDDMSVAGNWGVATASGGSGILTNGDWWLAGYDSTNDYYIFYDDGTSASGQVERYTFSSGVFTYVDAITLASHTSSDIAMCANKDGIYVYDSSSPEGRMFGYDGVFKYGTSGYTSFASEDGIFVRGDAIGTNRYAWNNITADSLF